LRFCGAPAFRTKETESVSGLPDFLSRRFAITGPKSDFGLAGAHRTQENRLLGKGTDRAPLSMRDALAARSLNGAP
jgi:hypothetical protein